MKKRIFATGILCAALLLSACAGKGAEVRATVFIPTAAPSPSPTPENLPVYDLPGCPLPLTYTTYEALATDIRRANAGDEAVKQLKGVTAFPVLQNLPEGYTLSEILVQETYIYIFYKKGTEQIFLEWWRFSYQEGYSYLQECREREYNAEETEVNGQSALLAKTNAYAGGDIPVFRCYWVEGSRQLSLEFPENLLQKHSFPDITLLREYGTEAN